MSIPPLQCCRGKRTDAAAPAPKRLTAGGLTLGLIIAVVFRRNLIILLSQLQPLLNISVV